MLAVAAGSAGAQQPLAAAQTPDLNLLVRHSTTAMGADGMRVSTEFSERVYRRSRLVWVERVLPAGSHSREEHAKGGKNHKHLDVSTAARWITLAEGEQAPTLRLVASDDKVVVDVPPSDYSNTGFDGSWPSAYHLIDPATLKSMRATGKRGNVVTYVRETAGTKLTIQWDARLQAPLMVESAGPRGMRKTVVSTIAAPAAPPWTQLDGYQRKDYTDYLD